MLHWTIEEKKLPLKYNWKLSRNETFEKTNFFIKVTWDGHIGLGEVAPNIRFGESPELIKAQFKSIHANLTDNSSYDDLKVVLSKSEICNSLKFGIDSAFIHCLCKKNNYTIESFFNLPKLKKDIATCYTIPILSPSEVEDFIKDNRLERFETLKIKVNTEGYDLINEVHKHYKMPLKIDANEAWKDPDNFIRFTEKLGSFNIDFLEQPFPSELVDEYIYLKKHSAYPIIGDESVTSNFIFADLEKQFHGINMKLMKAGSYSNGIDILKQARQKNMITMIGCMVETSLGISSALHLSALSDYADLDGFMIIKDDPFCKIKEEQGLLNIVE